MQVVYSLYGFHFRTVRGQHKTFVVKNVLGLKGLKPRGLNIPKDPFLALTSSESMRV